jgi:NADPH:quinone reductase-like Zn-dependent oxidoreductase/acyl carrier protein
MTNEKLIIGSIKDLDSLRFEACSRSEVTANEVEVENFLITLNFKDALYALGSIDAKEKPQFGWESVGRVIKVGSGVKHVSIDDWVMVYSPGIFSRYVTVSKDCVVKKPPALSFHDAATLLVAYTTAHYALTTMGELSSGQKVLIHSAASGVGLAAVQIANYKGAEIFATSGTDEKRKFLSQMGLKHVSDSRSLDFHSKFQSIEGGFDLVLNSLVGERLLKSLSLLKPFGRFLELGHHGVDSNAKLDLSDLSHGKSFSTLSVYPGMPEFSSLLREVMCLIKCGVYQALPCKIFSKNEVTKAFRLLSSGKHIGKIVIEYQAADKATEFEAYDALESGLTNAEGSSILEYVVSNPKPHYLVSKLNNLDQIGFTLDRVADRSIDKEGGGAHREKTFIDESNEKVDCFEQVRRIWVNVFDEASITGRDDFFELGGDSLLAIEVVYKIRKQLDIDVSPHLLLENSVLSDFVKKLET